MKIKTLIDGKTAVLGKVCEALGSGDLDTAKTVLWAEYAFAPEPVIQIGRASCRERV